MMLMFGHEVVDPTPQHAPMAAAGAPERHCDACDRGIHSSCTGEVVATSGARVPCICRHELWYGQLREERCP